MTPLNSALYNPSVGKIIRDAARVYMGVMAVRRTARMDANNPRLNLNAPTIRSFCKGYPFVVVLAYSLKYSDDLPRANQTITDWCEGACTGAFYSNMKHVIVDDIDPNDWAIVDTQGKDTWFWAFENEQDAIMFSLRW